jgi:hypothetical protein
VKGRWVEVGNRAAHSGLPQRRCCIAVISAPRSNRTTSRSGHHRGGCKPAGANRQAGWGRQGPRSRSRNKEKAVTGAAGSSALREAATFSSVTHSTWSTTSLRNARVTRLMRNCYARSSQIRPIRHIVPTGLRARGSAGACERRQAGRYGARRLPDRVAAGSDRHKRGLPGSGTPSQLGWHAAPAL